MPLKKRYYSVDGEVLAERSGGTRLDYATDALRSQALGPGNKPLPLPD